MKPKYSKLIFFVATTIICSLPVKGQNTNLVYDTATISLIQFNNIGNWPVFSEYKASQLVQSDFSIIDSLLNKAINDYNNPKENKAFIGHKIDLKTNSYKKQIITATNAKGEKEVWVNCFCWTNDDKWKTEIIEVDDGGSCFFNIKINLTLKKAYHLSVNGEA